MPKRLVPGLPKRDEDLVSPGFYPKRLVPVGAGFPNKLAEPLALPNRDALLFSPPKRLLPSLFSPNLKAEVPEVFAVFVKSEVPLLNGWFSLNLPASFGLFPNSEPVGLAPPNRLVVFFSSPSFLPSSLLLSFALLLILTIFLWAIS